MPDHSTRYAGVLAATIACFALLWFRLFDLQVVHHDRYSQIANDNRIQLAVDVARRGLLRDRHGTIVAQNDPSYSVYLMRSKAQPVDSVVAHLARVLERDSAVIMQRLRDSRLPYFEPVRVARHVPLAAVCRIEEQNDRLPGIMLRYETTRRYPDPAGGSHLLGYLKESSGGPDDTLHAEGSFVGVRGAESRFNRLLRGQDGVMYLDVTAAGQVVGPSQDQAATPSRPGLDVKLTIDWKLQRFAAEALRSRGIGSVVCLDPRTGEVLALVNVPGFDPNLFSGILLPEVWEAVVNDSTQPLFDRALTGLYPPGSTTKLITAGAGLELGLIAPSTTFQPCFGGMQFGNRYFRCWKAAGHGTVNLIGAIEQSCDVYFYQLAQRLGVENWAEYASECGFGERTGIDLPEEAAGLVPDSAYYNRRYGRRGWTSTLVLNLGIGQGEFLSTPLQLATFYAAVANGGSTKRPRVFYSLMVSGSETIRGGSEEGTILPFSKETLATLQHALRQVVAGEHATARVVNFPDLAIAGKTGTAQNPHGENHSWFACYAPFDKPEIVVVALVENAGQGSEVAAPLCGEILRFYFGLPRTTIQPAEPLAAETETTTADDGAESVTPDVP